MPLAVVSFALALHLEISPDEVFIEQRLEEDLGLDPLDLVLIALRLEEIEDAEFPVGELTRVATVGDLVSLVRSWHVEDAPKLRVVQ